MSVREYIGARYVPVFADPIEWDATRTYEPLTVVLYQGNSYTSRQYVPANIPITNDVYWARTGNYNAQVEQYRAEVATFDGRITANSTNISTNATDIDALEERLPKSQFTSTNTVKKYVDESVAQVATDTSTDIAALGDVLPSSQFDATNTVKKYVDDAIGDVSGLFSQTEAFFFGDSWGVSATSEEDPTTGNGFVIRIAELCGLNINNYHVRGAGFCNAGVDNMTMLQKLNTVTVTEEKAKATKYVFVCAGTNDGSYTQSNVGSAMTAYFSALAAKFPYSEVIYTPNYRKHQSALAQDLMSLYFSMATIHGPRMSVNSSITWMAYSGWWADDGVHPNPNGYIHFADMICANLFGTLQSFWPVTIGLANNCPLSLGTISSIFKDGIVHIRGELTANRGFSSGQNLFQMGLSLDPNIFPDIEVNSPMYSSTNKIVGMLRLYSNGNCQMLPSETINQGDVIRFNFTYLTCCYQYTA